MIRFLNLDFVSLAYRHEPAENEEATVLFLPGFRSDMMGVKSNFLSNFCQRNGLGYISLDYFGHGQSEGEFEEGTLSRWLEDIAAVIDYCNPKSLIVVGSSMGGWLMLQIALKKKYPIRGLVGIASAPDFTQNFEKSLTADQKYQLETTGKFLFPTPLNPDGWPIRQTLIDDSRQYYMLHDTIDIDLPMRLIHGCQDTDVPYETSLKIMDVVKSKDVHVQLIKDGDHRLSRDQDLYIMTEKIKEVV